MELLKKHPLDEEIERVVNQMSSMDVGTDEYTKAVKNLRELCEARGIKNSKSINYDTIITVGANLLGILLVLNYERLNIISSKAITFLVKPKI